jgi:hypothetical protein
LQKFESIAERKIREAIEAGDFDNLPNKGKPIPLDRDPFEDPSLWMAHHLLRVNGFAPPWIEESNEIDQAVSRFRADLADAKLISEAALQEFRRRAAEINQRILTYNLKSPSARFHKGRLDIEAVLVNRATRLSGRLES